MPADPDSISPAFHYELSEGSKLKKLGNCSNLLEQRDLVITDIEYTGFEQWSIYLKDEKGQKYYYGLNTTDSCPVINISENKPGDTVTFAFVDNAVVIPTAKTNSEIRTGDINSDGKVNSADTLLLQKWLLGDADSSYMKAADINGDGKINVLDLCIMKNELICCR